jgi:HAE1 family hydrophobic/amphiphilic exporter-1
MKACWNFFVDHYRFTFIVIAAIILSGVYAIISLPKESEPEVNIPIAVVTTLFPGASPIDVEELVTDILEKEISTINGIDSMRSVSRSGISSITVEFGVNTKKEVVLKDLEDAVDIAKRNLPAEAEDPAIVSISLSDTPFLQVSLGGDYSLPELTSFASQIEAATERVKGVSNVTVLGGQDPEIQVIIDKPLLDGYGISIGHVTRAIGSANSDIPVGSIETGGENFNIRLAGRLTTVEDIAAVPIGSIEGTVILLSDVAVVQSGYTTQFSASRLSIDNSTSQPAVTVLFYKSSGGDITRIAKDVKERMAAVVANDLPSGVAAHIIVDSSEFIQSDLISLTRNGIATVIIVFLLLLAFLGLREAIMASLAIPLSFLIAFVSLLFLGLSINFMTLFALILALGILVDSAIVINQAMHARTADGQDPFIAAKSVIAEFQWPLIAGTLTTVFAFVPMLLTSGIIGEYIKSIPITVSSVLIASLFVALAISTTLSAVFAKKVSRNKKQSRTQQYFRTLVYALQATYDRLMRRLIEESSARKILQRIIILSILVSYSLPVFGVLKVNMFPTSNEPTFAIDVELPVGTPLEKTMALMMDIEKELQRDPFITSYVVTVGQSSSAGSVGGSTNGHTGYITVDLVKKNRPTSVQFVETYQTLLNTRFPFATIDVSQGNFGPPSEAPVVITIEGTDLDELDRLAVQFESVLNSIPGTRNSKSTVVETNGEFVIYVNRAAAQRFGLTTTDVALTLRNAINGTSATSINTNGTDVDVVVRFGLSDTAIRDNIFDKTSLETIRSLTLATPVGFVPVSSIADIRFENSRLSIERSEGVRVAKVTSFTESGTTATDVFAEVQRTLSSMQIPDGYTIKLGGENEDIAQSFTDMFLAMILAVFLIAALMVLQFNSFKQMAIIILSIPLALIGVFPGLALFALPLSFPGIIGIVALVGIVVNNAIILIDTINTNIKAGLEPKEAIVAAGKSRLEPILLTTITTVFGLLPLAITEEVWRSLGFAIIFGLTFSTMLTLVVIPTLYHKYIIK